MDDKFRSFGVVVNSNKKQSNRGRFHVSSSDGKMIFGSAQSVFKHTRAKAWCLWVRVPPSEGCVSCMARTRDPVRSQCPVVLSRCRPHSGTARPSFRSFDPEFQSSSEQVQEADSGQNTTLLGPDGTGQTGEESIDGTESKTDSIDWSILPEEDIPETMEDPEVEVGVLRDGVDNNR